MSFGLATILAGATNAQQTPCDGLVGTVTGSYAQAAAYAHCALNSLGHMWDMFMAWAF